MTTIVERDSGGPAALLVASSQTFRIVRMRLGLEIGKDRTLQSIVKSSTERDAIRLMTWSKKVSGAVKTTASSARQQLPQQPDLDFLSVEFICWIHEKFYSLLPESLRHVTDKGGKTYPVNGVFKVKSARRVGTEIEIRLPLPSKTMRR
jgi:hypothetical protein